MLSQAERSIGSDNSRAGPLVFETGRGEGRRGDAHAAAARLSLPRAGGIGGITMSHTERQLAINEPARRVALAMKLSVEAKTLSDRVKRRKGGFALCDPDRSVLTREQVQELRRQCDEQLGGDDG